jgi:hypothetical protein
MLQKIKYAAGVAALALLASCGGGGGGGTSSGGGAQSGNTTVQTAPPTSDVSPAGQTLTITSLQLAASDIIANTKPQSSSTIISSIFDDFKKYSYKLLGGLIPNSYAVVYQSTYPPVTYDPNFLASRKLINGNLVRINPIVKYFEKDSTGKSVERQIQCDFTNTELHIAKSYELNPATGDLLVMAEVPKTVDKDCKMGFSPEILYVQGSGNVFIVTSAFKSPIADVIQANDPGFNNSNSPLVIDAVGLIKTIELQSDGLLKLTDLNTLSAPINTDYTGAFAYDGNMLIGASSGSNNFQSATYFVFKKGSAEFKILRPVGWSTNYYLSSILDDKGRILFHYASNEFQVLNTVDWSYTTLIPQSAPMMSGSGFPGNMYGAQGRYGKWILSDRGVLWNYESKASLCLMTYPNSDTSNYDNCAWGGSMCDCG